MLNPEAKVNPFSRHKFSSEVNSNFKSDSIKNLANSPTW